MKLNSARTSLVLVIIIAISLVIGFSYQKISDSMDMSRYPRPTTEYMVSGTEKMTLKEIVEKYSTTYGVPEYIIYSVIRTESSFNENAVSSSGAIGLMQLKPSTFEWLVSRTKEELNPETIYSPHINVKYGTYYLSYLYTKFGKWDLAIAAYNAGQGSVSSWLENPDYVDEEGNLIVIPKEETANYLKKVKSAMEVYKRLYYNS
ncbi:MAG: lytic transglycosylase domain-containing protein [Clostridia bacterium]|nr:lytic transglycosylase domain-containing protein [Clostridia bacterium]